MVKSSLKSSKARPTDCPCHSGARLNVCCGPLHRGEHTAATPEALMRSRYAAFALGLGDYLVDTMATTHPDRTVSRDELSRELATSRTSQRFLGLQILHTSAEGGEGVVLFHARIFERGADCSFAELSRFVREDGAWRYASGILVHAPDLPREPAALAALDLATFRDIAERVAAREARGDTRDAR